MRSLLFIVALSALVGISVCSISQDGRKLLAPMRAPGPAPHHRGFAYTTKDGPLAFTITAMNTTAEAKLHDDGKNTSRLECEIQGAYPEGKNPDAFRPGPLYVFVPVGQHSTITLNPTSKIMYKNATVGGSKNVTTVSPSKDLPTTLKFSPNHYDEHSAVTVGVHSGQAKQASCTLTVYFVADGRHKTTGPAKAPMKAVTKGNSEPPAKTTTMAKTG